MLIRTVPGLEKYYKVTSAGLIISKSRMCPCRAGTFRKKKKCFLKTKPSPADGYVRVCLYGDNRRFRFLLHRLVWLVFCGPIPDGLEINHKDGVKTNNRLDNLELVTHVVNVHHAIKIGLTVPFSGFYGEENGASKLKTIQVKEIRDLYATGEFSHNELAKKFGVVKSTVGCIVRGTKWKAQLAP